MTDDNNNERNTSMRSRPSNKEVRVRILDAAKKLFREKGFEGVSLNEIVAAVGVKKPTIYYYFGDKQGLFVEVLMVLLGRGQDFIIANIRSGMSLSEKLEKLSEGYLRFCPTSLMAMLRDTRNYLDLASQQKILDAYRFYLLKPFERIFEEGMQTGEIKIHAPRELALMYLGLIDAMTTQKNLLDGKTVNHKATAELLVDMMLNGLQAKNC